MNSLNTADVVPSTLQQTEKGWFRSTSDNLNVSLAKACASCMIMSLLAERKAKLQVVSPWLLHDCGISISIVKFNRFHFESK